MVERYLSVCRRLRCSLVFGFRVHNASRGNHQRKLPFTFIRQTPLELIFRERLQGTRVLTPSMKWRLASFIPTVIYRKLGNAPTPSYSSCIIRRLSVRFRLSFLQRLAVGIVCLLLQLLCCRPCCNSPYRLLFGNIRDEPRRSLRSPSE